VGLGQSVLSLPVRGEARGHNSLVGVRCRGRRRRRWRLTPSRCTSDTRRNSPAVETQQAGTAIGLGSIVAGAVRVKRTRAPHMTANDTAPTARRMALGANVSP
jgi:hypothetical protein